MKPRFFVGRVTVPAHKTEGGIIKPDSAFLLMGRYGDRPYAGRGFDIDASSYFWQPMYTASRKSGMLPIAVTV